MQIKLARNANKTCTRFSSKFFKCQAYFTASEYDNKHSLFYYLTKFHLYKAKFDKTLYEKISLMKCF